MSKWYSVILTYLMYVGVPLAVLLYLFWPESFIKPVGCRNAAAVECGRQTTYERR